MFGNKVLFQVYSWRTSVFNKDKAMADIKKVINEKKEALRQICKGFTSNNTGGCCGVSLPPEEQAELKRLKEGKT